MTYAKMSLDEFGFALLAEHDLDPVYDVLYYAQLEPDLLRRWLLAYWCCYNAGESSWLSEQGDFWEQMAEMAANETPAPIGGRWPRGTERRYFRGQKAVDAIQVLSKRFPQPELAVVLLEKSGSYTNVQKEILSVDDSGQKRWPMFGPWIAFKVGDMLERVLDVTIDFTGSDVFFFDSPRKAAEEWMATERPDLWDRLTRQEIITKAIDFLSSKFGDKLAPPSENRFMGLQEYETILCKWGSHMHSHYPICKDIIELREVLHQWSSVSSTAEKLHAAVYSG